MTQKDKELLLKDLCGRLPHGVKIAIPGLWDREITVEPLIEIFKGDDDLFRVNGNGHCIEYIKPYLFPLSSMTEEQKKECNFADDLDSDILDVALCTNHYHRTGIPTVTYNLVDWCNKNHFDYRGLIPMGLANDATGLNIY